MPFRWKPKSSRLKSSEYRAQGLSQMQMLGADLRSPSFEGEAHRQSQAVANSIEAAEDQAFIDAVSDWSESLAKH